MRFGQRAVALGFATTMALGACTGTATTTNAGGGGTATSSTAVPTSTTSTTSTTTVPKGPTTTADPTGKAELKVVTTPFGKAIGRGDGKVLYAWDNEADGTVKCVDATCIEKWPPLLAGSFAVADGLDANLFSLITRPDGSTQVALAGKPLYSMSIDEPGEANCQGADGWWINKPDGTKNGATDVEKY